MITSNISLEHVVMHINKKRLFMTLNAVFMRVRVTVQMQYMLVAGFKSMMKQES